MTRKPFWSLILLYLLGLLYLLSILWFLYVGPITTARVEGELNASKQRVVVSLTTTPHRIAKLRTTLDSISQQSIKPDQIYLNIPYQYNRDNLQYVIPEWLASYPNLTINRSIDFGPITKLAPTLELEVEPSTLIITIDDDVKYPKHVIRDLARYALSHPNVVVTPMNLQFSLDNNYKVEKVTRIFKHEAKVPLVIGAAGVAYRRGFFADNFKRYITSLPDPCYLADDLVISMYLARHKIPIEQSIAASFNPVIVQYTYKQLEHSFTTDALSYSPDGNRGNHHSYSACLSQLRGHEYEEYQRDFVAKNTDVSLQEHGSNFWQVIWEHL